MTINAQQSRKFVWTNFLGTPEIETWDGLAPVWDRGAQWEDNL